MPEIKCTVSNCEYWAQGNVCDAAQILITSGPSAGKEPSGANAAALPSDPARTAEECYCLTFEPRQTVQADDWGTPRSEEVEDEADLAPAI